MTLFQDDMFLNFNINAEAAIGRSNAASFYQPLQGQFNILNSEEQDSDFYLVHPVELAINIDQN
jgi:hypothetical protein